MTVEKENRTLLWLVAIGFFMETLDSTIVNTALPTMARALGTSPLYMQSVVIAYALTLAVFIPASGWLTDRFGTRKVFLGAIVIFTTGSLLCALSKNLTFLVLARVMQGAGGSMLLPVGRLAVLRAFPGEKYLPALSFVTVPALIGPLIGPTLGGWIVQTFSWHWIFLINIPIGVIGCFATYKAMPQDDFLLSRKFDFLGFVQVTTFMVSISLALDGLSELGFSQGIIFLLLVLGFAGIASYVFHAQKASTPLLSLGVFETRTFSIGILGNLFSRVGSTCMPFLIPLFLQLSLGYDPLDAGLSMIPLSIGALLAKRYVSDIVMRLGYRKFLLANTIFVGLMIASFALITSDEPKLVRILQFFIFGVVNSLQFTAMNTLTMKDLDKRKSGDGNSMFSMVQMLSMSFSVAAAGSLLATFYKYYDRIQAFHLTFFFMGVVTCVSAWIFWQLEMDEPIKEEELEELVTKDTL